MSTFREKYSFEERLQESQKIIGKFPERAPVIIEAKQNTGLPPLDKCKYLIPKEMTVGQFMYIIRKRLKLNKDQAIFIFVNNKLPVQTELIESLYNRSKDNDGFMYMTYAGESTFG